MSPSLKKARIFTETQKHAAVSTTHSGQKLFDLLNWLKENGCRGIEDGRFDFLSSDGQCGGSLGGFAAKDFDVGEVLFAIPLTCIVSLTNASNTSVTKLVRDAAKSFDDSSLVTSELLIWLFMISQLDGPLNDPMKNPSHAPVKGADELLTDMSRKGEGSDKKALKALGSSPEGSHFNPFVRSLDPESPSPLSWPEDLAAALIGTNMSTMRSSSSSIEKHSQFLDEVRTWATETNRDCSFLSADVFNSTSLVWARGHYLARRYPGKFSIDSSGKFHNQVQDPDDSEGGGDGREQGMMNLGALVPLLDILNHNPEREWLTFKVIEGHLNVICNHPISKGSEVFSNYGSLSNEMLLYAYGFCLQSNSDDAVTLQLMEHTGSEGEVADWVASSSSIPESGPGSVPSSSSGAKHLGTYYVRGGGMEGIPNELWRQLTFLIGEEYDGEEGEEGEGGGIMDGTVTREGSNNEIGAREKAAVGESKEDGEGGDEGDREENKEVDGDDNEEERGEERGEENDNEEEDDNDEDEEAAVEVGIEECEMLADCLQKKLNLLLSTQDRAAQILDSFKDPRALYVEWYREGQRLILEEAIEALGRVIN